MVDVVVVVYPVTDVVPVVDEVHPVIVVYILQLHSYDIVEVDDTLKTVSVEVVVWFVESYVLETAYCNPNVLK